MRLSSAALLLLLIGCGTASTPRPRAGSSADLPAAVPDAPEEPLRVAAGQKLSCALRQGAAVCWGGAGHAPTPRTVPGSSGAVELAAAGARMCFVRGDGGVACYERALDEAETVEGIEDARLVAIGPRHGCAVDGQGRVSCWGDPLFGKLGRSPDPAAATDAPPAVVDLEGVVDLALGDEHSCALDGRGEVFCWGIGADPARACTRDAFETTCATAAAEDSSHVPRKVAGLERVVDIAAHGHTTCALERGGSVVCFRDIDHDARGAWSLRPTASVDRASQIVLGEDFGCALADEQVRCWGSDSRGQRGDGDVSGVREPTPVEALVDAVHIAAGDQHACALRRGGDVVCWGGNDAFQVGDGTGGFDGSPWTLAIPGVVELDGEPSLLCARLTDGTIQCLGQNELGQLGDGTTVTRWDFAPVVDLERSVQLDTASRKACAVSRRGELRCWGNNRALFLGPSHRPEPATLSTPVRATWLSGIAEVATGDEGTCVRSRGGRVSCFGRPGPRRGESTQGSVQGLGRVSRLSGGIGHFCATTPDGRVRCWGRGDRGQIGAESRARNAAQLVPSLTDATDVGVGCAFSCALRRSGAVSCWGDNRHAQLGDGEDAPMSFAPVDVVGVSDATALGVGCTHACAAIRGGRIRCWGDNRLGQLGASATSMAETLTTLPAQGRLHVLSRGTCVDEGGGALRCFGALPGVAERADRPAPVLVASLP